MIFWWISKRGSLSQANTLSKGRLIISAISHCHKQWKRKFDDTQHKFSLSICKKLDRCWSDTCDSCDFQNLTNFRLSTFCCPCCCCWFSKLPLLRTHTLGWTAVCASIRRSQQRSSTLLDGRRSCSRGVSPHSKKTAAAAVAALAPGKRLRKAGWGKACGRRGLTLNLDNDAKAEDRQRPLRQYRQTFRQPLALNTTFGWERSLPKLLLARPRPKCTRLKSHCSPG